jgi:exodeoxyribonuclease VII small subunit
MGLEPQSVDIESRPASPSSLVPEAAAAPLAPRFEEILQELEALVTQLESGDLPLDVALRTFERGVHLTRECQAALSAAQQKVQLLLQRGDSVVLEELDRGTVEAAGGGASGALSADSAGE